MTNLFWWIRQIVLISISVFFVYFGIRLLISSYELNDPFTFLMTFFASNFIILISGTLIIGFAYRMIRVYKQSKNSDTWFWCCNTSFGKTGVTHISIKPFLRRATAAGLLKKDEHRTSNVQHRMLNGKRWRNRRINFDLRYQYQNGHSTSSQPWAESKGWKETEIVIQGMTSDLKTNEI